MPRHFLVSLLVFLAFACTVISCLRKGWLVGKLNWMGASLAFGFFAWWLILNPGVLSS